MFAAVTSATLVGVEPRPVRVEVHVGGHVPALRLVGLPDTAVREAKDRVQAALQSSGFNMPDRRVTVNLAPADLPKAGSAYDLPIALGLIAASGGAPPAVADVVALGELALDGTVRPARGGMAAAVVAARAGRPCLLPPALVAEGALVEGADTRPVASLAEAVAVALGAPPSTVAAPMGGDGSPPPPDLAVVRGQLLARRALEVAAAGGHHLFMWGPPGAGKTLLARCLPGILPPLGSGEVLEVAQVWSAAGRSDAPRHHPPFRSPHHTASCAALVGGGNGIPSPGELSLAHRGVLFLDELGEFPVNLLDALRQPVEEGRITIARALRTVCFPAEVQLVAATNPCPCGFEGDRTVSCRCRPSSKDRYRRRVSGPLLDRFDLRVAVGRPGAAELSGPPGEPSAAVLYRVQRAREWQRQRGALNRELCRARLDALDWERPAVVMLERAVDQGALSGRGFDRVRRVARTIADLGEIETVGEVHVAEALAFRGTW
jgi:magnesium chelatase family protein